MGNTNCDTCGHDKRMCDCGKDGYVAQEGGDHYQAEYQHWDWVIDCQIHYLPANCTKYISRWQKKNGVQDLWKAMTYLDKMIVTKKRKPDYVFNHGTGYTVRVCTDRIVEVLGLTGAERSIFELLSGPCPIEMLVLAHDHLRSLIATAQRAAERAAGAGGMVAPAAPSRPLLDQKTGLPGRAARATTQPPASSASTEVASKGVDGMEHPFGYDAEAEGYGERPECDFTSGRKK